MVILERGERDISDFPDFLDWRKNFRYCIRRAFQEEQEVYDNLAELKKQVIVQGGRI